MKYHEFQQEKEAPDGDILNDTTRPFENADVAERFHSYPDKVRAKLMYLRELIFETASQTAGVGELEEALRWGQPSYLTTASKSGSLIRIDRIKSQENQYAMYFHCQTNLVETFKTLFPQTFHYEGKRSIIFYEHDEIPSDELRHCISLALTYHLKKP